jgi:MFS transporter, DHA1 family, inner membrane transport protein
MAPAADPAVMTQGQPDRSLPFLLLLAAVQFTHIVDFMILLPLGPTLMEKMAIGPAAFGNLVSTYALSAGIAGLVATNFIDRFDRRTLLLWLYAGFALGTFGCAVAHTHGQLLAARAVCGAFGGVSGSLVMAAAADITPPERRASGLAIVMMAFAVAAAFGVPLGLKLADAFRWETPFLVVGGVAVLNWLLIAAFLPAMRGHLGRSVAGFGALWNLLTDRNALRALAFNGSLVFAHFTIIPMLAPFLVKNAGLPKSKLFLVYMLGGIASMVTSRWLGGLADSRGRVRVYGVLVLISAVVTLGITQLHHAPMVLILTLTAAFFTFASGRFVPATAIVSLAVPPAQRGAFMSLNSCSRDLMSGLTTTIGGRIIVEAPSGELLRYDWLGWIAVAVALLSWWLGSRVANVESGPKAVLRPV